MKLKIALATLALSLSAVTTNAFAANDAAAAIKSAKEAQTEAGKLGFEWRDMGKNIKKAEELAKDGKDKKAAETAKHVAAELDPIKKQAELAKSAGPRI